LAVVEGVEVFPAAVVSEEVADLAVVEALSAAAEPVEGGKIE